MKQEIRYKRLELALLRSFCLAAEHGSFSRAAERQGLSTPAVWKQVRALERIMGTSLLKRRGKVVEQTEDGRLLLELVAAARHGARLARLLFHARRPEVASQITVASPPSTLAYYLPLPVKEFTERYPAVRLRLRSGMTSEVVGMVQGRRGRPGADGLLLRGEPGERSLLRISLRLLSRPADLGPAPAGPQTPHHPRRPRAVSDHHLSERRQRSPGPGADPGQHNLTERLHTVIETRSVDIARRYARLDVGIAILYMTLEMASEFPELHIRPIDPAREKVPMGLVTRKNVHRSAVVQIFRQLLRDRLGTPSASPSGLIVGKSRFSRMHVPSRMWPVTIDRHVQGHPAPDCEGPASRSRCARSRSTWPRDRPAARAGPAGVLVVETTAGPVRDPAVREDTHRTAVSDASSRRRP